LALCLFAYLLYALVKAEVLMNAEWNSACCSRCWAWCWCVKPLGTYMANVMDGKPTLAQRMGGRVEAWIYRDADRAR
jgi:hypothetical protein